jgi:hypothetical protein
MNKTIMKMALCQILKTGSYPLTYVENGEVKTHLPIDVEIRKTDPEKIEIAITWRIDNQGNHDDYHCTFFEGYVHYDTDNWPSIVLTPVLGHDMTGFIRISFADAPMGDMIPQIVVKLAYSWYL